MPTSKRRQPKLWNASSEKKRLVFSMRRTARMKMSCYCGKTWKQPNFGIHCFKVFDNRNSRFATVPSSKKLCFYEHGFRSVFFFPISFFFGEFETPPRSLHVGTRSLHAEGDPLIISFATVIWLVVWVKRGGSYVAPSITMFTSILAGSTTMCGRQRCRHSLEIRCSLFAW
jgi:hypothetical protein